MVEEIFQQIDDFIKNNDHQKQLLSDYVELLLKWNSSYNLIGRTTEKDIWQRHILDSAQLSQYVPDGTKTITDFGSGAGLPGVILSVLFPDSKIHMIESNGKKAGFLKEVKRKLGLNFEVHNERVEELEVWKSDVVTARAFAPMDRLLEYIYPFYAKDSLCVFPKGYKSNDEIAKSLINWNFETEIFDSILKKDDGEKAGKIILVRGLNKKP